MKVLEFFLLLLKSSTYDRRTNAASIASNFTCEFLAIAEPLYIYESLSTSEFVEGIIASLSLKSSSTVYLGKEDPYLSDLF